MGKEHILHFLQQRDLSAFNPFARPPRTVAHDEVAADGQGNDGAYLSEALGAAEPPFDGDLIVINHVIEYLVDKRQYIKHRAIARVLRAAGAVELGQQRIGQSKPHVWAIRDVERWRDAPESEIAAAYRPPGKSAPDSRISVSTQPQRQSLSKVGLDDM